MHFFLIGLDYKSASLKQREEVYKKRNFIASLLKDHLPGRAAVLTTCNRAEIYGWAHNSYELDETIKILSVYLNDFFKTGYLKLNNKEVFLHSLRLASGLESQLKGEIQILEQLTGWYSQTAFPIVLKRFWNDVIVLAREIRLESGLSHQVSNIAALVIDDILSSLKDKVSLEIALIGTGKVAELFVNQANDNITLNFVAHKNFLKAKYLAGECSGKAKTFADLPGLILRVDAVISATTSPHYILENKHFSGLIDKRESPLFVYDLALPRDVNPEVGISNNIVLRNQGDLTELFEKNNKLISKNIALAEELTHIAVYSQAEKIYA